MADPNTLRDRVSDRCADLRGLRGDHDSQRDLLQVHELRRVERLRLRSTREYGVSDWGVRGAGERGDVLVDSTEPRHEYRNAPRSWCPRRTMRQREARRSSPR